MCLRRFHLERAKDISGISGIGPVAQGVIFTDGQIALHWESDHASINIYHSIDDLMFVHGHGGSTEIVFDDPEPVKEELKGMEIKKRTIIVGDIHGCIDEFNDLIIKLSYDPKEDRLILLGDLLDRGPDSVGCVRLAREMNLESVMGNHEYKFVKWYRSQGTKVDVYDRKDHYSQLSDQDVQYIMSMPTYIELDDVIVVHAGLKPGILLSNQTKDDLMYLRYTDDQRKFISLKKINKLGKEAVGAKFWTEFGPFSKSVVYGHNVNSMTDVRIDKYENGTSAYGIDCGACFGGYLTALVWETREIVQVQAKKVYYQSNFEVR